MIDPNTFETEQEFVNKIKERFGICIDTCHLYVAGNKISSLIKNIHNICGIDKVKLCHLNSSKNDFGSRIDRHESIKNGKIKLDELKHSINEVKPFYEFINEDGTVEKWTLPKPVEEVKAEIQEIKVELIIKNYLLDSEIIMTDIYSKQGGPPK